MSEPGMDDDRAEKLTAPFIASLGRSPPGHRLLDLLSLHDIGRVGGRVVLLRSQAHDPEVPRAARTGGIHSAVQNSNFADAAGFDSVLLRHLELC